MTPEEAIERVLEVIGEYNDRLEERGMELSIDDMDRTLDTLERILIEGSAY